MKKNKKYFKNEKNQEMLIENYRQMFFNLTLPKRHKMVNILFDSIKEATADNRAIYLYAISKFQFDFFNFFANMDLLTKRKIIEKFLFSNYNRIKSLKMIVGSSCFYVGNDAWINKLLMQLYMEVTKKYIIEISEKLKQEYNISLRV